MDVIKVISIAFIGVILHNLLKGAKSELSVFVLIASGVIILGMILRATSGVLVDFQSIIDISGVDGGLFSGVLKVIGVAYVAEYASGLCRDAGAESLSGKILLAGKVCIFSLSLPLVKALVDMLVSVIK